MIAQYPSSFDSKRKTLSPTYLGSNIPPLSFSLDVIEYWTIKRIELLRHIEQTSFVTNIESMDEATLSKFSIELLAKHGGLFGISKLRGGVVNSRRAFEEKDAAAIDEMTFFILHLALSDDADQFKRHASLESKLFSIRSRSIGTDPKQLLSEAKKLIGDSVHEVAVSSLDEDVVKHLAFSGVKPGQKVIKIDDFLLVTFLLPFEKRLAAPIHGCIYLSEAQLNPVVASLMEDAHSSQGVRERTVGIKNQLDSSMLKHTFTRLVEVFKGTSLNMTKTLKTNALNGSTILSIGRQCFPPCALRLIEHFLRDSHLRHMGRQQLTLFLKGVGISFEDCDAFLGGVFARKYGQDGYVKRYQYNVAHCYGVVGGRHDYSPFSCGTILKFPTSPGEFHGCPFFSMGMEPLLSWLRTLYDGRMNDSAIDRVRAKKPTLNPQAGCNEVFDILFPDHKICDPSSHPTEWVKQALMATNKMEDMEDMA